LKWLVQYAQSSTLSGFLQLGQLQLNEIKQPVQKWPCGALGLLEGICLLLVGLSAFVALAAKKEGPK
jgi:hypothetical protein